MPDLSPWHLLILAGIFVLLFGAAKLPKAARSLGQSMRIFKAEMQGLQHGEDKPAPAVSSAAPQSAAQPGPVPEGTVSPQGSAVPRATGSQPPPAAPQPVTVPEDQRAQQSG